MKLEMEYYKYLLCGLLMLNFIKQGIGMPTTSSTVNMDDEASMGADTSYPDDYADEEPNPEQKYSDNDANTEVKLLNATPTAAPYFPTDKTEILARNGDEVLLKCNPINYNNNVILWYKDDKLIISGHEILNHRFAVKDNNKLVISEAVEMDSDNYYCEVFPQKVRHRFELNISEESIETNQLNAEFDNGASCNLMKSYTFISLVLGMIIFLRI